jgi:hypothetical protein
MEVVIVPFSERVSKAFFGATVRRLVRKNLYEFSTNRLSAINAEEANEDAMAVRSGWPYTGFGSEW